MKTSAELFETIMEIEHEKRELRAEGWDEEQIEAYVDFFLENYFPLEENIIKENN